MNRALYLRTRFGRHGRRLVLCLLLALTAPIGGMPAAGQESFSIAAVVNDDLISIYDLQSRIRLLTTVTNLDDTPETRQRLQGQAMRTLIDERLQLQEAARLNITVSEQEVRDAIAVLERQNRLPAGGLEARLQSAGVPLSTLFNQVRATIAWGKVIRRQVRPQVEITDEEVDEFLDQLRARGGGAEYEVSEIFIPSDSAADERAALQTAETVVRQAQQGTPFATLARQFSQAPSAGEGGDLGRVQEGQLDRRLDAALREMQPGQISPPIRVENGYYVLQLRDRRQRAAVAAAPARASAETFVSLRRIFIPAARGLPASEMKSQGEIAVRVSDTAQGCQDMDRLAQEVKAAGAVDIGRIRLNDLPERLRQVVERLPIGKAGPPIQTDEGFLVLMVCDRSQGTAPAPVASSNVNLPEREEVIRNLGTQRVDMLARRYLRDLRRAAFVDIRT